MSEYTQEQVNEVMAEMASSMNLNYVGNSGSFVSPYNTAQTKYTGTVYSYIRSYSRLIILLLRFTHFCLGPYAIVSYEGPKIQHPDPENRCMVMHTNPEQPVGKVLFANGATYEGGFRLDMMHGYGTFIDPDGNIYQGGWVDDKREGQAVFACKYCRYVGEYKDNKRNGQGVEEDGMGNVFVGRFCDGDAISGKMSYANGDVYVGEMKDSSRHGRGKFISCEEGFVLDGDWIDDEFVNVNA
jgi:hypothetical protein